MKKIALLLLLLSLTFTSISQEKEDKYPQDINKKTEIKINALTLLAAEWLDFSYERLIDEESSFGIAATLNTDTSVSNLKYSITPFYRRYFSEKYARGFFVEGFGMLFSAKDDFFINNSKKYETGFGVGISIGGKFVSKKGFSTEILLGLGRNFSDTDYTNTIGRIGISLGYRFFHAENKTIANSTSMGEKEFNHMENLDIALCNDKIKHGCFTENEAAQIGGIVASIEITNDAINNGLYNPEEHFEKGTMTEYAKTNWGYVMPAKYYESMSDKDGVYSTETQKVLAKRLEDMCFDQGAVTFNEAYDCGYDIVSKGVTYGGDK